MLGMTTTLSVRSLQPTASRSHAAPTSGIALITAPGNPPVRVGFVGDLKSIRAGLIEYTEAWEWQRQLHAQRVSGEIDDTVLLLEHPPVFTAGKRTENWERPLDGTPVIDVDRGGKITWHGPGQLVGYPIVELPHPMDVMAYVRRMEQVLIEVCADLGLTAGQVAGRSGVWLAADDRGPERKVAAIGVRVSHGVTLHGFALNCNPDLSWFGRIVPCGIADAGVTSLTEELGREVTVADALPVVEAHLPELVAAYAVNS
jgi:lipoyl(octanoyl) transferase